MRYKNLSLIGPPGSGKGSYGRHLAKALEIPLLSMSDVLRQFRPDVDLSSGHLVDDRVVSEALLEGLSQLSHLTTSSSSSSTSTSSTSTQGYILDGFPRTLSQAHLMEETWPSKFQLQAAVKLAVPDKVCETKLLGRRICVKCNGNYNVNDVDWNGWYLPPSLPPKNNNNNCSVEECANKFWTSRPDDQPAVIQERLAVYHQHMDPILDYFEEHGRLLKLTPYKGYDDVPEMLVTVQKWLDSIRDKKEEGDR
jgi:adenylate kinase